MYIPVPAPDTCRSSRLHVIRVYNQSYGTPLSMRHVHSCMYCATDCGVFLLLSMPTPFPARSHQHLAGGRISQASGHRRSAGSVLYTVVKGWVKSRGAWYGN